MITWLVLCQEVVRDGRTGVETAGGLVGIRSDLEIVEFASLDEAVEYLAFSPLEIRLEIPQESGWERWREMPPLMKKKFERLCTRKREPESQTATVGMMLAKVMPAEGSESGWSIFFIAVVDDHEHVAPDLDRLADILAPLSGDVVEMPDEGRAEGVYTLPASWRQLLDRLIAAKREAVALLERVAQK
jgi:hypothetical protein